MGTAVPASCGATVRRDTAGRRQPSSGGLAYCSPLPPWTPAGRGSGQRAVCPSLNPEASVLGTVFKEIKPTRGVQWVLGGLPGGSRSRAGFHLVGVRDKPRGLATLQQQQAPLPTFSMRFPHGPQAPHRPQVPWGHPAPLPRNPALHTLAQHDSLQWDEGQGPPTSWRTQPSEAAAGGRTLHQAQQEQQAPGQRGSKRQRRGLEGERPQGLSAVRGHSRRAVASAASASQEAAHILIKRQLVSLPQYPK